MAASPDLAVFAPQPDYPLTNCLTCRYPAGSPWMVCVSTIPWISSQARGRWFNKQNQGMCWWCSATTLWAHTVNLCITSKSYLKHAWHHTDTFLRSYSASPAAANGPPRSFSCAKKEAELCYYQDSKGGFFSQPTADRLFSYSYFRRGSRLPSKSEIWPYLDFRKVSFEFQIKHFTYINIHKQSSEVQAQKVK